LPRVISNQKCNEYLKELGKTIPPGETKPLLNTVTSKTFTKGGSKTVITKPKWEALCTHTARRSFATNEYLSGMPTLTIMAITGHKTEKAFLRYIKLTPNEHAKLMQMKWKDRNELKAV
jgi:integrase